MKKYLSFVIAFAMLIAPIQLQKNVSAESDTEIIVTSGPRELSKTVHELTDNAPVIYAEENCDFPSNRIIVISEHEFDYCGAEIAVNDSDGMYVLMYGTKSEAETAYNELLKNPYLDVVPDIEVSIPAEDDFSDTTEDDELTFSIFSNHLGWGADFIGSDEFVDTLYSNYGSVSKMPDVVVAVIDTGVDYNHEYLQGRVTRGYDYINSDSYPMDDHSHGTHVAGIICDNTPANVEILAYKTLDSTGSGYTTDTISAIKDAQKEGADIINLSLGAEDYLGHYYSEYASFYRSIIRKGVTIVAAAGNESTNTNYVFPANMDEVITVSACNISGVFDNRYSNYGSSVDICAPGTSIYSTVLNDSYGTKSGTSMACPHASAAAALLKTADPDLDPDDIEDLLRDGAIYTGSSSTGFDSYYGYGLLNLESLAEDFLEEEEPTASPTPTPTATPKPTASPTPEPTATPKPTASPTPTPEPGLPSLTSATITDEGYITVNILDNNGVLADGVTVSVAGYKNKELAILRTFDINEEYKKGFLFADETDIDTIKIYVWDSLGNPIPISKIYKTE